MTRHRWTLRGFYVDTQWTLRCLLSFNWWTSRHLFEAPVALNDRCRSPKQLRNLVVKSLRHQRHQSKESKYSENKGLICYLMEEGRESRRRSLDRSQVRS